MSVLGKSELFAYMQNDGGMCGGRLAMQNTLNVLELL